MSEHEMGGGSRGTDKPIGGGRMQDASDSAPGNVVLSPGAARVLAIVVLLTIGLAGMAGGVALDRYFILPRRYGMRPPGDPRGGGGFPFGPRGGGGRGVFIDRLNHYLELSPAQRVRFDSLMNRQERELREARAIAQPRIDSIVTETRREIDSILTPSQREKLRKLREEGLGGPGGGFGAGRDSAMRGDGGGRRRGAPPPFH